MKTRTCNYDNNFDNLSKTGKDQHGEIKYTLYDF